MKKPTLFALATATVALLALTSLPHAAQAEGDACYRKEFKTQLIADACKKGGQAEAKKVMKKFIVSAKAKSPEVKDCKSCHTTLTKDYGLNAVGMDLFIKTGGK